MNDQWQENELDSLLDEGLDSLPMVALPAFFVQNTMRQIQPVIRFRLQFVDVALPVIGTMAVGFVYWLFLAWQGGEMPILLNSMSYTANWGVGGLVALELLLVGIISLYLWKGDQLEWATG